MPHEQRSAPDHEVPHASGVGPSADDRLTAAANILEELEAVLVNVTATTQAEITEILASNGNFGGIGLLIDQVQFTRRYLTQKTE